MIVSIITILIPKFCIISFILYTCLSWYCLILCWQRNR
nr:MAG TPA: hypothetical protein [Caudoviricetes sp.]DAL70805.1 MAG TPA: hypothetical protein [Caudoviricetes sp.]DAZ11750.1 MAG TPA: hypothetical protein [Caudoviricetes sp.]